MRTILIAIDLPDADDTDPDFLTHAIRQKVGWLRVGGEWIGTDSDAVRVVVTDSATLRRADDVLLGDAVKAGTPSARAMVDDLHSVLVVN